MSKVIRQNKSKVSGVSQKLTEETALVKTKTAIKKNTFESVLMRWMKLEPIIQSEVSQKEKHQYSILMHIIWNLERW